VAYHPIENYGIVGDLHTVALVAENASIDFMCFPRFDSPTVFASLLDEHKGGCFKIHPNLDQVRHKQLYLPDSNVLVSRFLSEQGVAEVNDFMPVEGVAEPHTLVRRARTVRGEVRFRMLCAPRFDYARAHHTVERVKDGIIFSSQGRDGAALGSALQCRCERLIATALQSLPFQLATARISCSSRQRLTATRPRLLRITCRAPSRVRSTTGGAG